MTHRGPFSRLDKRLAAEAVALALHPARVTPFTAIRALGRLARGNRTAIQRAIARVALQLDGEPSHVGERALEFLRQALDEANGEAIA